MKNASTKRLWALFLAAVMLAGLIPVGNAEQNSVSWRETDRTVTEDFLKPVGQEMTDTVLCDPNENVRVSIVLEEKPTVQYGFATANIAVNAEAMAYDAALLAVQKEAAQRISRQALGGRELDVVWNLTLVGNVISANVPRRSIDAIAKVSGVRAVVEEQQYDPCTAEATAQPMMHAGGSMTGAHSAWSLGLTGAGSRVAVIDTGTDLDHQSFDNSAYLYALSLCAEEAGMETDAYLESLNLLDAAQIEAVLARLNVSERTGLSAQELYLNEKHPFVFNYVDADLDVTHDHDGQGEHGSHVAGIAAANRFIPREGGFVNALEEVYAAGAAPDAQLITMKVFGKNGGAYESDYMAAIEDAIWLGADAVNLSLGSANPGPAFNDTYASFLEYLQSTDTVVVVSAGNSGYWAKNAWSGGYLYHDGMNFDTVGMPGSYTNSLAVASVDNIGSVGGYFAAGDRRVAYTEYLGFGNRALAELDTTEDGSGTDYPYIFIDGIGAGEDYEGLDLTGKVVFCARGSINFAQKANNAAALGAAAVIICNNQPGELYLDLTGLSYSIPAVSIRQSDAEAIRAGSESGNGCFTGTVTVYGKPGALVQERNYHIVSSFSSWGIPGDLSMKPEIAAPGGGIWSVWGSTPAGGGSDQYEMMSGTSMAAPQITGMTALLAQHLREQELVPEGMTLRQLAQSLLMSTAQPMKDEQGRYHSILSQGSGLGRVDLAVSADSYVLVEGQADGKVKAELHDDPERTGEYRIRFTLNDLTGAGGSYILGADVFTQAIFEKEGVLCLDTATMAMAANVSFTVDGKAFGSGGPAPECDLNGDGVTNAQDADHLLEYLLGNADSIHADGDVSGDGTVNTYDAHVLLEKLDAFHVIELTAGGKAEIEAVITLTDAEKARLEIESPAGAYIEAYLHVRPVADGAAHSIPVLGYYGSWTDSSMFDIGSYAEYQSGTESRTPYLYGLGFGLSGENRVNGDYLTIDYGDGTEYYWGGNPVTEEAEYLPRRNAFNNENGSKFRRFGDTLIRNAAQTRLLMRNTDTGEVYRDELLGAMDAACYYVSDGSWGNYRFQLPVNWAGTDMEGNLLPEGTTVELSFYAAPEYYCIRKADGSFDIDWDALGAGAVETTYITVDNTAPVIESMELEQTEGDILTVKASDNQYVAAVALLNARGTATLAAVPGNQTEENTPVELTMDLSGIFGDEFLVAVYDYAKNVTVYEVELNLRGQRPYYTVLEPVSDTGEYLWKGYDAPEGSEASVLGRLVSDAVPCAVEYIDGYVFTVTGVFDDFKLQISRDDDLEVFYETELDPGGALMLLGISDLAYSSADGKLYALASQIENYWANPYLITIDMELGGIECLGELPMDMDSLACDRAGNFYGYESFASELYTFTADSWAEPVCVGSSAPYSSSFMSSGNLTWNDLTDKLNWVVFLEDVHYLLEVEPTSGAASVIRTLPAYTSGLFVRTETTGDVFVPSDTVHSILLPETAATMIRNRLQLSAVVRPWTVSDYSVTWHSSDESVAVVDENGLVTALSKGTAVITAASVLDPGVTASCTVTVEGLDQQLQGIVWDENSSIWWSSFNTDTLPQWEKCSAESIPQTLVAATRLPDGRIFASDLDENMTSRLYSVDPVTLTATEIGGSGLGYFDLAWAPNLGESGMLVSVYGPNVLLVDPESGQYRAAFRWSEDADLVAIAYCETLKNSTYYEYVDYFYMIDSRGRVYKEGFMDINGVYYYYDGPQRGLRIDLKHRVSTPLYHSAYYDADSRYLYWSSYNELDDRSELLAVHMGDGRVYDAGAFGAGIWPVGGLMGDDGEAAVSGTVEAEATAAVCIEPELLAASDGSLNSTGENVIVHPVDSVTVAVPVIGESTNGIVELTFDEALMRVDSVTGHTDAFAWTVENGKVRLAYASGAAISDGELAATVTFLPRAEAAEATVTLYYGEWNRSVLDQERSVPVVLCKACPSAAFADLELDSWYHEATDFVLEEGLMNGMSADLFEPAGTMNRAQLVTILYRLAGTPAVAEAAPFEDVPAGTWFTDAVVWARDNGITTGVTETHFAPGAPVAREQMVTFLARYYALQGVEITGGDLSAFRDADSVNGYARPAMAWAVENGIIQGVTADMLMPHGTANRAQIATILMRCCETIGR